jgi:putative nucleotidyltransferase with HDIG domain
MSSSVISHDGVKVDSPNAGGGVPVLVRLKNAGLKQLMDVNRELWLLLTMFAIAAVMNFVVDAQKMVLGFYTFPTLLSAYFFGRRHAVLTACGSIFLVGIVMYYNPHLMGRQLPTALPVEEKWFDVSVWGGILIVTAYTMGTLYEHKQRHMAELRDTYNGILLILQQFISKDKYTQNHSYRVSVYACRIAREMGMNSDTIEDIRAAALLHDIGKLDVSREILYKAAKLTKTEYEQMQQHVSTGVAMLSPVGGSLRRVLPIILAHHDKYDGTGYTPKVGDDIPLEARILSVADVYDSLTSDRPYRKAMSPFDAKEIIVKGSGTDFDPRVVNGFVSAFQRREMEVPEVVL